MGSKNLTTTKYEGARTSGVAHCIRGRSMMERFRSTSPLERI